MLSWVLGKRNRKQTKNRPPYDEAKRIAANGDDAERRELASHTTLEPELLYYLAEDDAWVVRREVAKNDGAPLQADQILAKDPSPEVRSELAYKIGRLIPTLTDEENKQLTEMAFSVLATLAEDELPDVRAIISEEIKSLESVPQSVIGKLARDAEVIVSAPVLEYSPLLSEQELVQIIASGIQGAALIAIARRRDVVERISDAIVERNHAPSLVELLKNQTSKISEKAMQVIGMTAPENETLHRPLVERSNLSMKTMRRIATFVSAALVETLIERNHLPDEVITELRHSIRERIEAGQLKDTDDNDESTGENAEEKAERLFKAGELNEATLLAALDNGEISLTPPALSLMSGLDLDTVKRILMGDSGKGVVALAWKAGLSMEAAEVIEQRVANVPSRSLVLAPPDGAFPLSEENMEWYLAYFDD